MFIKNREVVIPKGMKLCPTCGKFIPKKEKHPTVTMVVRKNNHFSGQGPGAYVEVEPQDVEAFGTALMTVAEHEMLEAERAKPKPPKRGQLAALVEQQFKHAKAQVSRIIEGGKRSIERNREQAIEAAQDLAKNKPSAVDQEPASRESQEVEAE